MTPFVARSSCGIAVGTRTAYCTELRGVAKRRRHARLGDSLCRVVHRDIRRQAQVVGALAFAMAVLAAVAWVLILWAPLPVAATARATARAPATARATPEPTRTTEAAIDQVALVPGSGAKALFFGDSLTAGFAASPPTRGYAHLTGQALGWDYKVNGISGTGYVNPGISKQGTYVDRITALPADEGMRVVVIQGGLNDAYRSLDKFPAAAAAAVDLLKGKYPAATVVILGPTPASLAVDPPLSEIDAMLRTVAAQKGLTYISPVTETWVTAANYASVSDVTATSRPDTKGHLYLAERTTAALRALQ
jgi:lysophospholipase L1-like esterase